MPHQEIANALITRVEEEQKKRDNESFPGNFAESSLIEFLYRYWLESELYKLGYSDIEREVPYPRTKLPQIVRRRACDIKFRKGGIEYWAEIKVAYSNTTYTQAELNSDIEKLSSLSSVKKLYIVVFVSESGSIPSLMKGIGGAAEKLQAKKTLRKKFIPTPKAWEWPNSHIHVGCYMW